MDTMKKKPDFNSLDLSSLSTGVTEDKVDTLDKKVPAPVDDILDQQKPKSNSLEGYWVNGKSVEEVSLQEMKEWLAEKLPGVGVEDYPDSYFSTPKARRTIVNQLATVHDKLLLLNYKNDISKKYKH